MSEATRPQPYDFLAEKAIIGSILKKNETFDRANQIIKKEVQKKMLNEITCTQKMMQSCKVTTYMHSTREVK